MKKPTVLMVEHPERGTLYAAVDPAARFVEGRVCERRFSAFLAPFTDEARARAALDVAAQERVG